MIVVLYYYSFYVAGGKASNVQTLVTNVAEDSDTLRQQFASFVGVLLNKLNERQDQEERDIMNLR